MASRIRKKNKIHLITLGCSKNTVDSEKLMGQLSHQFVEFDHNTDTLKSRTVIINTCGFINDAKQESIDTILTYVKAKQSGLIDHLFVFGCLSERYANDLRKEIPEVDKYFGVNNIKDIIESLGYQYKNELLGERLLSTPSHYAYLKISEGCDRECSFCAIPSIRGAYKSESIESLVDESKQLALKGTRELILIAQDLSAYGKDLYGSYTLPSLIENLSKIEEIEWIRLHYLYPLEFTKDLIRSIKENQKVCRYFDIPFQHISDNMLKVMRRGQNKSKTLDLIHYLREQIPELAIRTSLLVGHPGETEKDFKELVDFVQAVRFDRLGVFMYSHEENTWAHKTFKDTIPAKVKKERADIIMKIQQSISQELNEAKVSKIIKVLIDRMEDDYYVGRTEFDSPEIDNEVLIPVSKEKLKIGNFYNVYVETTNEFDLTGYIVK